MSSEAQEPLPADVAISVRNLTKTYRLFDHPGDRVKQFLSFGLKRYHRQFTALKDISFDIKKGETVGIIGRNGSGKSTLLQLICGILNPSAGSVKVNGRISALLELGAGFNPEFTGRENVYFHGTLMGFSKEQMDERFDDIAAFADIGEFIDQPVRTYSSGMFVRLAFAVGVHVSPDIMVIDEALAVGDSAFQAKCMIHLKSLQKNGTSVILFVSHDLIAVQNLCTRVLTLGDSHLLSDAEPGQSIDRYLTEPSQPSKATFPLGHPLRQGPQRFATLQNISVMNAQLEPTTHVAMGERIVIDLEFECRESLPAGRFGVTLRNLSGVVLHDFASGFSGIVGLPIGRNRFRLTTSPIMAYPGRYHIGAWVQHSKGVPSDDRFDAALAIEIYDEKKVGHQDANFSGIRCSNTETYLPCSFEKM